MSPPIDLSSAHAPARHDGPVKVTGQARYAGEEKPPGTLHGVLVPAPVARGRVLAVDVEAALREPGVVRVLTARDLPTLGAPPVPPVAQSVAPLADDVVRYEGQPVALVLGETLEATERGAGLVELRVERDEPRTFDLGRAAAPAEQADGNGYSLGPNDTDHGDFDAAWVEAARADGTVRVDAAYETPSRHHNMMEPSTTVAWWRDGRLHLHDSTQWTYGVRYALAALLDLAPEAIDVRCPFTGGGFGAKGYVWPHQILAAVAARVVRRPVAICLGRTGCYTGCGYQPRVHSRVRLAAGADGGLRAICHESTSITSTFDDYVEFATAGTRGMYEAPAIRTRTRIVRADVGTPTAMRAPHEGPGMFALESAMDELAHELGIDPLELRLRNDATRDPLHGTPFSSKQLRAVYREGAERFGWSRRAPRPRAQRRDGKLVGQGMAAAIMTTFRFPASARIRLSRSGALIIEAGSQEIGTGVRTVMPQIAAEVLGVPASTITMRLGDTSLPETGGTFGSSTTLSVGSAVHRAALDLRARLARLAGRDDPPPPAAWPDLLAAAGVGELLGEGRFVLPDDAPFDAAGGASGHSMHTWGAVFVEMEVDEELGVARMRRAVAGYSAGRILNPRLARSQMIGGIIWGYGRAMLEQSVLDQRSGRYLSKNLSSVHLPVNADIPPSIEIFFADEHDPHASEIGARGIGELGEVGVAAAIANAIFHATGRRLRTLPILPHDLVAEAS